MMVTFPEASVVTRPVLDIVAMAVLSVDQSAKVVILAVEMSE